MVVAGEIELNYLDREQEEEQEQEQGETSFTDRDFNELEARLRQLRDEKW